MICFYTNFFCDFQIKLFFARNKDNAIEPANNNTKIINKVENNTNWTHTLTRTYPQNWRKLDSESLRLCRKVHLFVSSSLFTQFFDWFYLIWFDLICLTLICLQFSNVHLFDFFACRRRCCWNFVEPTDVYVQSICINFDLRSGCIHHHSRVYVFRFWLSMLLTANKLRVNCRKTSLGLFVFFAPLLLPFLQCVCVCIAYLIKWIRVVLFQFFVQIPHSYGLHNYRHKRIETVNSTYKKHTYVQSFVCMYCMSHTHMHAHTLIRSHTNWNCHQSNDIVRVYE